jgi:hypothetical protein
MQPDTIISKHSARLRLPKALRREACGNLAASDLAAHYRALQQLLSRAPRHHIAVVFKEPAGDVAERRRRVYLSRYGGRHSSCAARSLSDLSDKRRRAASAKPKRDPLVGRVIVQNEGWALVLVNCVSLNPPLQARLATPGTLTLSAGNCLCGEDTRTSIGLERWDGETAPILNEIGYCLIKRLHEATEREILGVK